MKQPPTEVTRAMRASRGTSCRVSGALPPASSRMTQQGFIIVFAVFVSALSNSLALAQEARLAPDPIQTAETKAMREGRWADAEKIPEYVSKIDTLGEARREQYSTMVLLAAASGLRAGELLAPWSVIWTSGQTLFG